MRSLYVFAVVFLIGAGGLVVLANDEWEEKDKLDRRNAGLQQQFDELNKEASDLERLEPFPLKYAKDALSEVFTRSVEAGEVLGAGVRVESRNASFGGAEMRFLEFKSGVQKCEITVRASMEREGAGAVITMLEEELKELPVSVRKTKIRVVEAAVSVNMDVDVFGR